MVQILNNLIRWIIFFGILYLVFVNFATFLTAIFAMIFFMYYAIYRVKKRFQQNGSNKFEFTFNNQDFNSRNENFSFNDFEEQFRNSGFNTTNSFNGISKAKDFFGFNCEPTRDQIKKRYKELAKKYHPDLNNYDDTLMKQLNHYKEVLLKAYPN